MANRIEIPPFPQNKRIAVTLSFDDGVTSDIRALEMFNACGLKATWNLNSGRFGGMHGSGVPYVQAGDVAKIYAGHEVAIHTVNHPFLQKLDASQIAYEVLDNRKALEDLVGYPVRGMAYPYGTFNAMVIDVLRALGIVYARTTQRSDAGFPPAEPLAWPTTGHMFDAGLVEKWQKWYDVEWSNGLFFVWGHTYEFHKQNDWGGLERVFRPLSGKPDAWYCTNVELFDYQAARERLVIAANRRSVFNPSGRGVTILVDNKVVEVPGGATINVDGS